MHDPTTKNRQGGDTGTQYRSGIFYHSPGQAEVARDITRRVQAQWWTRGKVETEVLEAGKWWDAEDYHQLYLDKNPGSVLKVFLSLFSFVNRLWKEPFH